MILFLFCLRGIFKRYSDVFETPDAKSTCYAMYKGYFVHIEGDNETRQGKPLYHLRVGTEHFYGVQEDVEIRKEPANATQDVSLRSKPDPKSSILKLIKKGHSLLVYDLEGDYLDVEYEGVRGFIPASACDHKEPSYPGKNDGEKAALIVETKLGCPYDLSNEATGPFVFDCSGLMKYAYNLLDIFLNRTANNQIYGEELPMDESKWLPGDVITFHTDDSNPTAITHVGMYFGNGYFIHASTNQMRVRRQKYSEYPYKTAHVVRYFKV